VLGRGLELVIVPGIPEAPVRGAAVIQADLLADVRLTRHVGAADRTRVQLLPVAFSRWTVCHGAVAYHGDRAPVDQPRIWMSGS
jgi:hypothetical protein